MQCIKANIVLKMLNLKVYKYITMQCIKADGVFKMVKKRNQVNKYYKNKVFTFIAVFKMCMFISVAYYIFICFVDYTDNYRSKMFI